MEYQLEDRYDKNFWVDKQKKYTKYSKIKQVRQAKNKNYQQLIGLSFYDAFDKSNNF